MYLLYIRIIPVIIHPFLCNSPFIFFSHASHTSPHLELPASLPTLYSPLLSFSRPCSLPLYKLYFAASRHQLFLSLCFFLCLYLSLPNVPLPSLPHKPHLPSLLISTTKSYVTSLLLHQPLLPSLHSKPQHAYNTHNTTRIALYIGNIFCKNITHITATYKISEHLIGVIVVVWCLQNV